MENLFKAYLEQVINEGYKPIRDWDQALKNEKQLKIGDHVKVYLQMPGRNKFGWYNGVIEDKTKAESRNKNETIYEKGPLQYRFEIKVLDKKWEEAGASVFQHADLIRKI